MAFGPDKINEVGSGSPGGVIEAVKRAVVTAFRAAMNDTTLSTQSRNGGVHVDLEYPLKETEYPGIWVQFSLTSLTPSGMGMMEVDPSSGDTMQQMRYEGRVTLLLVALTSIERDRLADKIISTLSFSRMPTTQVITKDGFTPTFTTLYEEFDRNPYVSLTINSDRVRPNGQSVTVGVPWDETSIAYEDSYGFEVAGEFMMVTGSDGLYRLKRVDIYPEISPAPAAQGEGWM